jgi:hypothetical protein
MYAPNLVKRRASKPLRIVYSRLPYSQANKEDGRPVSPTRRKGLGVEFRVTENVVVTASYRYQYQRFEEADTTADSNSFFLSLSYVWPTEIRGLSR